MTRRARRVWQYVRKVRKLERLRRVGKRRGKSRKVGDSALTKIGKILS